MLRVVNFRITAPASAAAPVVFFAGVHDLGELEEGLAQRLGVALDGQADHRRALLELRPIVLAALCALSLLRRGTGAPARQEAIQTPA
jgi:hypothetical protein